MDKESIKAAGLLAAIAESNYHLACFADVLRQSEDVLKVSLDFECSRNSNYFDYGRSGSPYLFDWYVDFTLVGGRSLAIFIEMSWDESTWILESRLETSGENGPVSLVDGPDRRASSIDDLIEALSTDTTGIIEAAKRILEETP